MSLAEENRVLAGACRKLVDKVEEVEGELVAVQGKNEWLEEELDRADEDLNECLEQQRLELREQCNVEMVEGNMARGELLLTLSMLEEQLDYFRERCSEEGADGETYTEGDYLSLEEERNELAFKVSILTERLEETKAELVARYEASTIPITDGVMQRRSQWREQWPMRKRRNTN